MQPPPVIEEHPANTNASLISSINLTCTAEGSVPNYQWLKDGVPIAGETRAYLYIEETVPEDRGNYTCVAINGGGRDESEPARIKIPGMTRSYNSGSRFHSCVHNSCNVLEINTLHS